MSFAIVSSLLVCLEQAIDSVINAVKNAIEIESLYVRIVRLLRQSGLSDRIVDPEYLAALTDKSESRTRTLSNERSETETLHERVRLAQGFSV